ncbi:hypothetical protein MMC29_006232 [Sticta canariensis]|nr:hypothetical protein [Sticta canariensis]
MHFSIPLLVLAAGALSSPLDPEKRNLVWETVYTTVQYVTDVVYVTATPAAAKTVTLDYQQADYQPPDFQLPTEFNTYRRHRHTRKNGSPRATTQTPAAPTPQQLQVSIQTLTPTSTPEIKSEAESSYTPEPVSSNTATSVAVFPSKTAVTDIDTQPPTTFVPDLDTTSHVYKALVLQHHNIHRRNHSAPDLTWSDEMAQYAETTAKTCKWGHSL